jgi:hypothetical protein
METPAISHNGKIVLTMYSNLVNSYTYLMCPPTRKNILYSIYPNSSYNRKPTPKLLNYYTHNIYTSRKYGFMAMDVSAVFNIKTIHFAWGS